VQLSLVVLAAGLGSRFGGDKTLAAIGPDGEALLDYALFDARRAGIDEAVVVVRRASEDAFRDHLDGTVGDAMRVRLAFQDRTPLPPHRSKPWGTGHALLTAGDQVRDACVVVNGDDYYGPAAIQTMADHLRGTTDAGVHAVGGFRLDATPFSERGGVSRALIARDANGNVRDLIELLDIRRSGDGFVGRDPAGQPYALDGSEAVSMNLWGFHRQIFPALREEFDAFAAAEHDRDAEFLIGPAVARAVAAAPAAVRVLPVAERGIGLTWAADRTVAARAMEALITAGRYPPSLAAAFREPPPGR
jgi:CTP:molybdopterin cytidylyltransferase MocA